MARPDAHFEQFVGRLHVLESTKRIERSAQLYVKVQSQIGTTLAMIERSRLYLQRLPSWPMNELQLLSQQAASEILSAPQTLNDVPRDLS